MLQPLAKLTAPSKAVTPKKGKVTLAADIPEDVFRCVHISLWPSVSYFWSCRVKAKQEKVQEDDEDPYPGWSEEEDADGEESKAR